MELLSPTLRVNFREWCVAYLVLRTIDDLFTMAGIQRGCLSLGHTVNGARRTRVEEYYASIDWRSEADAEKFLQILGYALAQTFLQDDAKSSLRILCQQEGLVIDGIHVYQKLPSPPAEHARVIDAQVAAELKQRLLDLDSLQAQQRGYAFERFLTDLFSAHGLVTRGSFRIVGEQIDGSLEIDSDTYLLEAKWCVQPTSEADLLVFRGKVESKTTWARGLFLSYNGFSKDALDAFALGKATNLIGMTGQDLFFILDEKLSLSDVVRMKARRAVETGEFYVRVFDLTRG
jgi:hypothetical protein